MDLLNTLLYTDLHFCDIQTALFYGKFCEKLAWIDYKNSNIQETLKIFREQSCGEWLKIFIF